MSELQKHFNLMSTPEFSPNLAADMQQATVQAQLLKREHKIRCLPHELPLLDDPEATWVIAATLPSGLRATIKIGFENGNPQLRFGIVIPRGLRRTPELLAQVASVTLSEDQEPVIEGTIGTKSVFIQSIVDAIQKAKPSELLVNVYKRS